MGTSSQWQQLFKYAFNYLRATKGPRMAKAVDDRGRGARLARRDEGAYCWYVTQEQRSEPVLTIGHISRQERSPAEGVVPRAFCARSECKSFTWKARTRRHRPGASVNPHAQGWRAWSR